MYETNEKMTFCILFQQRNISSYFSSSISYPFFFFFNSPKCWTICPYLILSTFEDLFSQWNPKTISTNVRFAPPTIRNLPHPIPHFFHRVKEFPKQYNICTELNWTLVKRLFQLFYAIVCSLGGTGYWVGAPFLFYLIFPNFWCLLLANVMMFSDKSFHKGLLRLSHLIFMPCQNLKGVKGVRGGNGGRPTML